VLVGYSGGNVIDESDATFTIENGNNQNFGISTNRVSHLYWPFYNSDVLTHPEFHVFSEWEGGHLTD
jgi:hypothetical protein